MGLFSGRILQHVVFLEVGCQVLLQVLYTAAQKRRD